MCQPRIALALRAISSNNIAKIRRTLSYEIGHQFEEWLRQRYFAVCRLSHPVLIARTLTKFVESGKANCRAKQKSFQFVVKTRSHVFASTRAP
jgi:hypothetical protein